MARRRKKDSSRPDAKGSPLVYGIVFLLAGALVGGVLTTAVHMTPDKAQSGVQQGGGLSSQIEAFADRVALNPRDGEAWIALGNLYFDTHQHEKSIEAYARALEINPGNPNVLTDMGVMHRALGEYQKALDAFARAIEADPFHETARMNTGVVLLHDVGDRAGAVKAWQELAHINPQARNAEGTLITEVLRQMGKPVSGAPPRLLPPAGGS